MQVSLDQREQPDGRARATRGERRERGGAETSARAYARADLSGYSFKQRLIIRAADLAFYVLINAIGRTTRFEVEGSDR